MLNLSFTLQGDHEEELLRIQARGVVAALYSIYGDSVLPMVTTRTDRVGEVSVTVSTTRPPVDNAHVADGATQFTQEEIDAAAAFQGNTAEYLAVHADEPDAAAAFGGTAPSPVNPYDRTGIPRDKAGIPWDERIHSSTKGTNKDGTWSRRRNTSDATFDAVMAELKAANTSRTMEAASAIIPPPPSSVPAPPTAAPAQSQVPAAPAASSSAPGAIDPASPTAFPDIMRKITGLQAAQKLKPDELTNLLTSIGANPPSVGSLMKDKSLIPILEALLDDHAAMQG